MQIHEKVIIVTGGANGIGRELIPILLAKGAKVIAIDKDEKGLQEIEQLTEHFSENYASYCIDLTDYKAVIALKEQIHSDHRAIDVLVNDAGTIQQFVKINTLDLNEIERVMDNNFYSMVIMTKAFLPHLLQRPEALIVNFSSMGGYLPVPGQGVYGASKAAVMLFTEALFAELLSTNVGVSLVFPGAIDTNIAVNSGVVIDAALAEQGGEKFKPMSPSKAAQMIVEGIEKDKYRIFLGSDAKFMNILYRIAPKFATKYIARQMALLLG